jgi:hypothetical protein
LSGRIVTPAVLQICSDPHRLRALRYSLLLLIFLLIDRKRCCAGVGNKLRSITSSIWRYSRAGKIKSLVFTTN